jgi:hypothetical protein
MTPTSSTTTQNDVMAELFAVMHPRLSTLVKNGTIERGMESLALIHELQPQQTTALENQLVLTLLGLSPISDFEARAKAALAVDDEKLVAILEDMTISIFTPENTAVLLALEAYLTSIEPKEPVKTSIPVTPAVAPAASAAAPAPEPVVTHAPEPIQPAPLPKVAPAPAPAAAAGGKMVGFKKETLESTVKGMRTMRGDINRLRGPEDNTEAASFTKPFGGK